MTRKALVVYIYSGYHFDGGGNTELTFDGPLNIELIKETEDSIKEKGKYDKVVITNVVMLESGPSV